MHAFFEKLECYDILFSLFFSSCNNKWYVILQVEKLERYDVLFSVSLLVLNYVVYAMTGMPHRPQILILKNINEV